MWVCGSAPLWKCTFLSQLPVDHNHRRVSLMMCRDYLQHSGYLAHSHERSLKTLVVQFSFQRANGLSTTLIPINPFVGGHQPHLSHAL